MSKVYAGIGSRETPAEILGVMTSMAEHLERLGWTLRSGCAPGADTAFEKGTSMRELYLPWPKFEGRTEDMVTRDHPQKEAFPIAEQHHPAWGRLTRGARSLHARNVHQILGPDVTTPVLSKFVICWTPEGKGGGGTGQAIRIAEHYEVPVFDLAREEDYDRVTSLFMR